MASAGTVTVEFAAEFAKFKTDLKQINDRLKGMESSFASVSRLAKSFIPVLSAGAILSFAKNALAAADALGDVADQIGLSVTALSQLQFAAQQSDVEVDQLNKGLTNLSKNISEAGIGTNSAEAALDAFNITAQELSGLTLDQQFAKLSDQFINLVPPADRVRVATDLFGKGAEKLIPLLLRGASGLKEFAAEADRLGISLDERATQSIDRANKALDRFGSRFSRGFANRAGTLIADIFGSGDELADAQAKLDGLIEQRKALLLSTGGRTDGIPGFAVIDGLIKQAEQEKNLLSFQRFRADAEKAFNAEKQKGLQLSLDEVTVTAKRVRVPGSPENLDELIQDFQQQAQESIDETILKGGQDLAIKLAEVKFQPEEDLTARLAEQEEERAENRQFWRDFDAQQHQQFVDAKLKLEQGALNAGLGLLQAFAGRSKAAAIAAIAINKGLAIARAIQNTAVAVTMANTLPPPANIAAIAHAKLLGASQIALIAATGFVEAGNVGSRGASLGSSANPVFTNSTDTSFNQDSNTTASSSRAVQVVFNGNIYNNEDFKRTLADALKELDDIDTVIFSGNGAQAQRIRNAA